MAIVQAVCDSFLTELLTATHDFTASTGHTFKIALYNSDASLGNSTTSYSATNEISGAGYSAGGATLTNITPVFSNGKAYIDFSDITWSSASFTARGALIYNSSAGGNAVAVMNFGSDRTKDGEDFVVSFPSTTDPIFAIIK